MAGVSSVFMLLPRAVVQPVKCAGFLQNITAYPSLRFRWSQGKRPEENECLLKGLKTKEI